MLTVASRFYLYDISSVFMLALVISLRSSFAAKQMVGAILAGVFASSFWPMARELCLIGSVKPFFTSVYLQVAIFVGAILGAYLGKFSLRDTIFVWAQVLSISLLATFGFLCGVQHLSVPAALLLSMFLCILPDFISDLIIGDAARFVDESSYVLRAMLGAILAAAIYLYLPRLGYQLPFDIFALAAGLILPLSLQFFQPK
ncbi:MAG: hypothetical protein IJT59_04125 [Desulfovibrionaceae bacterium]|nr:hypothetical protein [Desulfovibrionaceae bacterium]